MWDKIGKVLANVAKYAGQAALWASEHPEVIAVIKGIADGAAKK